MYTQTHTAHIYTRTLYTHTVHTHTSTHTHTVHTHCTNTHIHTHTVHTHTSTHTINTHTVHTHTHPHAHTVHTHTSTHTSTHTLYTHTLYTHTVHTHCTHTLYTYTHVCRSVICKRRYCPNSPTAGRIVSSFPLQRHPSLSRTMPTSTTSWWIEHPSTSECQVSLRGGSLGTSPVPCRCWNELNVCCCFSKGSASSFAVIWSSYIPDINVMVLSSLLRHFT